MTESRFHKIGLINCHHWNGKLRSHLSWPTLNLAPWYLSFSSNLPFFITVFTANRIHAFCQAKTSWPVHSMWMENGTLSASVFLWRNSTLYWSMMPDALIAAQSESQNLTSFKDLHVYSEIKRCLFCSSLYFILCSYHKGHLRWKTDLCRAFWCKIASRISCKCSTFVDAQSKRGLICQRLLILFLENCCAWGFIVCYTFILWSCLDGICCHGYWPTAVVNWIGTLIFPIVLQFGIALYLYFFYAFRLFINFCDPNYILMLWPLWTRLV